MQLHWWCWAVDFHSLLLLYLCHGQLKLCLEVWHGRVARLSLFAAMCSDHCWKTGVTKVDSHICKHICCSVHLMCSMLLMCSNGWIKLSKAVAWT